MAAVDKHLTILAIFVKQQLVRTPQTGIPVIIRFVLLHLKSHFQFRDIFPEKLQIVAKLFVKCNTLGARDEASFARGKEVEY